MVLENSCISFGKALKAQYIPDCDFDGDMSQGGVGDCIVLSKILAILSKPNGAEILKKHMEVDENLNTTVTFSGLFNKKITVSFQELNSEDGFSDNADFRALEIAWDKLIKIGGANNVLANHVFNFILLGNYICSLKSLNPYNIFYSVPGPTVAKLISKNYYQKEFNNPDRAYSIAINLFNYPLKYFISFEGNEDRPLPLELATAHAYAITGADKNYV